MNGREAGGSVGSGTVRSRAFRIGDEAQLIALFNRVFRGRGRPRDLAEWRWLYRDTRLGRRIAVAEDDTGRIVAHYAGVPLRMTAAGQTVIGAHCIDSMVDPAARRGLRRAGPFQAVARYYFDTWGDRPSTYCNFGFPNRAAYRIGTARFGYRELFRPIPTLFYNSFQSRPLPRLRDAARGVRSLRVTRFGADADELWRSLRGQFAVAIQRDAAYLNWRYVDCPRGYEPYLLHRGGTPAGVAVYRRNWSGPPIFALVDCLAAAHDDGALAAALALGVDEVDAGRQARFETWLPARSPWFARALEFGLDTEPSPFVMVCRIEQRPDELDWLRDRWFYTMGDTDVH